MIIRFSLATLLGVTAIFNVYGMERLVRKSNSDTPIIGNTNKKGPLRRVRFMEKLLKEAQGKTNEIDRVKCFVNKK